jgi:type IV pilus assembly protein PilF
MAFSQTNWVLRTALCVGIAWASVGCTTTETGKGLPGARESNEQADLTRRAAIRTELAANYFQQGNFQVAIAEANEAIRVVPTYAAGYGMLGLIYMTLKENDKADTNFQKASSLAPNDPEISVNHGWFLCQTGRERESIDYFLRASRDPLYRTPATPFQNAGVCSLRLSKDGDAEDYFKKALAIDGNNVVSLFNLSEVYLRRNDLIRAKAYSDQLLEGYAPTAQTLWLAMRIARKSGANEQFNNFATQLRRRFQDSTEWQLFVQNRYD